MMSNSVTHLRSYTNSTIADIDGNSVPISPVTPRDRRRLCIERRRLRIERDIVASNDLRAIADVAAPNADLSTSSADVYASSADIVVSNDKCFMMFHNVLSVSWCLPVVHDVSQCFPCVSWCFTMFNNVLWCLARLSTIGVTASAPTRPPIASGIAITPQKSAMALQGSSISPRTWSHAKLHPE